MNKVTSSDVARYLQGYIVEYRREYALLTSPAPEGGGFPDIGDHPALDDAPLDCFVCRDGVVLSDASKEPPDGWHIAGGPAIMTDFPDTRTPPEITALLTRLNPHGD